MRFMEFLNITFVIKTPSSFTGTEGDVATANFLEHRNAQRVKHDIRSRYIRPVVHGFEARTNGALSSLWRLVGRTCSFLFRFDCVEKHSFVNRNPRFGLWGFCRWFHGLARFGVRNFVLHVQLSY